MSTAGKNIDEGVVEGFGDEWSRFDQSQFGDEEARRVFELYFKVFPWASLPKDAVGLDVGCGSGRWAKLVAPRVGKLHCVDASADALAVAKRNLAGAKNVEFHVASVDAMPIADSSMDFVYSLGVLHHIPDTAAGIADCVRKLKPGAPFLVYLYYGLENRPFWFRQVWNVAKVGIPIISRLPLSARYAASQVIAATVYYPLARSALVMERLGMPVKNHPLYAYRNASFYTMRTDALDRFGTRLYKRFTKEEIRKMMADAGLERITFHDDIPFWTAVGYRR